MSVILSLFQGWQLAAFVTNTLRTRRRLGAAKRRAANASEPEGHAHSAFLKLKGKPVRVHWVLVPPDNRCMLCSVGASNEPDMLTRDQVVCRSFLVDACTKLPVPVRVVRVQSVRTAAGDKLVVLVRRCDD